MSYNGSFTNHGLHFISMDIWGYGQYWTRLNDRVYFIPLTMMDPIYWINPSSPHNITYYTSIPIASYPNSGSCISSSNIDNNNYLFIAAGNIQNDTQIFNITNKMWLTSLPSLKQKLS